MISGKYNFLIVLFICSNLHANEIDDDAKKYEFQKITLQRSWHYASMVINEGSPEVQKEHARTMVSAAFHYWLMRKNELIKEMEIYEAQIRKTFKDKKLDAELLNDPLGRLSPGRPSYFLKHFNINDDQYLQMIPEFKKFILEAN
jgi:hypothetical protein